MSQYFGVQLKERSPNGFPKKFDMVSANEDIVGDAKFLHWFKERACLLRSLWK